MGLFNSLFKPAWMSENYKKQRKAAEKATDQNTLSEIALKASDDIARAIAVKKITDQSILAFVLKNDSKVAYAAITNENLTDQSAIGDYVRKTGMRDGVEKLTDQTIIADILIKDSEIYFSGGRETKLTPCNRDILIEKVTDQSVLKYIAENAKADFNSVKEKAVNKLTDQSLLIEIAKTDINAYTGRVAAEKITDQSILAEIALTIKETNTCWSGHEIEKIIIEKINNQVFLEKIVRKASNFHARTMALHKISNQSILADVAKNDENDKIREFAFEKLTDKQLRKEIGKLLHHRGKHLWVYVAEKCKMICEICGEEGESKHNWESISEDYYREKLICTICGAEGWHYKGE